MTAVAADHGATVGYSRVIVRGSGFTTGSQVTFGSTPAARVKVLSTQALAVDAPGHRHGVVHVRVQTKAGRSRTSDEDRYTYVHQVTPGTWQAQTAPVPPGQPADDSVDDSQQGATSCPSPTVCYSVGSAGTAGSTSGDGAQAGPVITTRIDGQVTTQQAPLPTGVDRSEASLYQIDCPAVGSCAAAGSYGDGLDGLLLVLANGTWTAQTAKLDAGTGHARVQGLSCGAPGDCIAISHDPVLYRLHDGTWTGIDVRPPGWKPGQPLRAYLDGVDCASAAYCLVAGAYDRGSKVFVDQLVDGEQSVRAMPKSPGGEQPGGALGVQCRAVGRCTVLTDFYRGPYSGTDASAFVTVQDGRSFAFRTISVPGDAGPESGFATSGVLSCPEVSVCFDAVEYSSRSDGYVAAVVRLDHAKVHRISLPRPDPAEQVFVSDIDCVTAGACTAVGSAEPVGDVDPFRYVGAYFSFANGVWTTEVAQPAAGQEPEPTSTSYATVECPAPGACVAGGTYEWDIEPYDDDGTTRYAYQNASGIVGVETPN